MVKIAIKNCVMLSMDGMQPLLGSQINCVPNLDHGVEVVHVVELDLLDVGEGDLVDVEGKWLSW